MSKEKNALGDAVSAGKEAPEAAAPVARVKKKGDLMYLGPTITGVARHGTVFKDGILPEGAKKCVSELPMIERLFVELEKIPGAVKELRKKQSALGAVYEQTAKHFNIDTKRRV